MKTETVKRVVITLENEEIRNVLVALEILHGTDLCQLQEYELIRQELDKFVDEDMGVFRRIGLKAKDTLENK